MGGRDHHRWESVGPLRYRETTSVRNTGLLRYERSSIRKIGLCESHIAEDATEVKAVGKSAHIRDLC